MIKLKGNAMKKFLLLLTTASISSFAGDYRPYMSFQTGYSLKNKINENGPNTKDSNIVQSYETKKNSFIGLTAGYHLWDPIRAELQYLYMPANETIITVKDPASGARAYDKGKIYSHTLGVNMAYDLPGYKMFDPYLMAGIGATFNKTSPFKSYDSDNNLINTQYAKGKNVMSWHLGVGASLWMNDNFVIDIGYRFIDFKRVLTAKKGKVHKDGVFAAPYDTAGTEHYQEKFQFTFKKIKSTQIVANFRYYL